MIRRLTRQGFLTGIFLLWMVIESARYAAQPIPDVTPLRRRSGRTLSALPKWAHVPPSDLVMVLEAPGLAPAPGKFTFWTVYSGDERFIYAHR